MLSVHRYVFPCLSVIVLGCSAFIGYTRYFSLDSLALISSEELTRHDKDSTEPWLSLLGHVFDVSKGASFYAGDGSYSFFSGRDATRAFVSGDFKNGLIPDIRSLPLQDYKGLYDWLQMYHDKYKFIGYLVGHFFDASGHPTEEYNHFLEQLNEAKHADDLEQADRKKYPMCNSQSGSNIQSKVWCTNKSGGVDRSWAGYPRIYKKPGQSNSRCGCIPPVDLDLPVFALYSGCEPLSESCLLPKP